MFQAHQSNENKGNLADTPGLRELKNSCLALSSRGPPKAAQGPLREIPDDLNAQKCNRNQWFFNDFEMALNALGGGPNVAKGSPMAPPSPPERWPNAPKRAPWTTQHESEVPKIGSNRGRGFKHFQSG